MARSTKPARKSKSIFEQDRYTAELSTSQLVTGVCILLMFGLACFLLGVLIGKADPSLRERTAAVSPEDEPPIEERNLTVTRPAETETTPALPPELRIPPNLQPQRTPPPAVEESEPEPEAEVEAEPDPEPEPEPMTAPPAAVAESTPAQPESVTVAQSEEPEESPEPAAEQPAAVQTSPPPAQPAPSQPAASEPARPTPRVAATTLPEQFAVRYGVQIGYFTSQDGANRAKRDLEGKSKYTARIVPTASGKQFKVVVGEYPDWASADRARKDLLTNFGYQGAFPVSLD